MATKARIHAGKFPAVEAHLIIPQHDAGQDIALPDELGHEDVLGLVINIHRCADLLDDPFVHHHNGVAHGEGFFLVVGHIDEGDAQLLLHPLQLDLHPLAQLQIQGPQGFVQEQYLGPVHQGPGNGHPLLLAAGQLLDPALFIALEVHQLQHLLYPLLDLRLGELLDLEAEGDVIVYVQVGE